MQEDFTKDGPVGIAELPVGPNGKKITWAGTNGWIATRESTAEASAKFIEYLMSDEVLKQHHLVYGSGPLYASELEDPAFQHDYWDVFYRETQEFSLFGMIGRNSATPPPTIRRLRKSGSSSCWVSWTPRARWTPLSPLWRALPPETAEIASQ